MSQITSRFGVILIALTLPLSSLGALRVGTGVVDITPYEFEIHYVKDGDDPYYATGGKFFDTGVDRLFDFEESGALGSDGKPGKAGVDDDKDGKVDNCSRQGCKEYLAKGSDDVRDPKGDNFHKKNNPKGTEADGEFQYLHLAGFRPYYPMPLENRFATGIHDPIWSRALAVEGDDGNTTLLISTDLPGLTWKHINPVRRRIQREFGVLASNIVITSTHNHAGPDAAGFWSTVRADHNHDYTMKLREQLFQSAAQAIQNLQPAEMKVVTTSHYACYDRKTKQLKREPECRNPVSREEYEKDDGTKFDLMVIQDDKRDPIVRNTRIVAAQFVSPQNGETIATFINWHNHPDSLMGENALVSSDYAHYLRGFVEKKLGGVAVYFTGTVGCQIGSHEGFPVPLWSKAMERYTLSGNPVLVTAGWERIRSIGYEIGSEVVAALSNTHAVLGSVPVAVKTDFVDIRVDNFLHLAGTQSVWTEDVEPEDQMQHYKGKCDNKIGCVRTDLSLVRIGELSIITAPGEVDPGYFLGRRASTVDYPFPSGKTTYPAMPALDQFMGGTHRAILGQANNYLSYLVHGPDNHGWYSFHHPMHYEEFVTVGKDFGDDVGDKLMEMMGAPVRYSERYTPKKK